MSGKAISYQIRIRMTHDQKYSYDGMFSLYIQVMNQDAFFLEKRMSRDSFDRLLRAWTSLDGGWLAKDGRGAEVL